MKYISILGSTGSIGVQTLQVVSEYNDQFNVVGLSAGSNVDLLKTQIETFKPTLVSIQSDTQAKELESWIQAKQINCKVCIQESGLIEVATHSDNDLLIVAIVGTASLLPTYEAIQKKIPIALACKEVLVSAGDLITQVAQKAQIPILPIDSEHAAIKQCLAAVDEDLSQVSRIILTASGGPFWQLPKEEFKSITKESALRHPNWEMGAKITIDSATLLNKGLEVIEAHHLFDISYDQLEVIIHPQSTIHSLVEFTDGNLIAHLGLPDMRFPIQYALTYPEKWKNPWPKTSLTQLHDLQFIEPDLEKFPMLKLAIECGKQGGNTPAIMNAANEAAVSLFLDGKIHFLDIYKTVAKCVEQTPHQSDPSLPEIIALDAQIKEQLLYEHA